MAFTNQLIKITATSTNFARNGEIWDQIRAECTLHTGIILGSVQIAHTIAMPEQTCRTLQRWLACYACLQCQNFMYLFLWAVQEERCGSWHQASPCTRPTKGSHMCSKNVARRLQMLPGVPRMVHASRQCFDDSMRHRVG